MRLGLLIAALTLALDWGTKRAVLAYFGLPIAHFSELPPQPPVKLTEFLNLVLVWNRGVSFGLFASDAETGRMMLIGFAVAVTAGLVWWLAKAENRLMRVAIGLVIGGAVGNIHDRLVFGAVEDFLDFHAFGFHWYAFNVADAAIVIGVALIALDAFRPATPSIGVRR